jgi:hypothetical protein
MGLPRQASRRLAVTFAFRAFLLLAAAIATACAHEAWSGGALHKDGLTVTVGPIPPAWQRIDVTGADLAFRDSARAGSALFDVGCDRHDDDAPLSVLTEHLIMGTTERQFDTQDVIPFDGREAMHSLLRAKLDGVPMRYDIYVLKKDGCVYDLVYVAPPDRFADGSAEFERFAGGLHAASGP